MRIATNALPIRWSEWGASDKYIASARRRPRLLAREFVATARGAAPHLVDPVESLDSSHRRAEDRNAVVVTTRKFGELLAMTFVRLALASLFILRPSSRGGAIAHG